MTGYYFVRMIDDLMDRDRPPPAAALPALIVLHTEFQRAYHRYFPHAHPFWDDLSAASLESAETASKDAGLSVIGPEQFIDTSARKIAGAKIPIAAVCHRYERPDLLSRWHTLVDLLGRWHQMGNDILGWSRDLEAGRRTYFLSEGAARAGEWRHVSEWVLVDGLAWGRSKLDGWMQELQGEAAGLDCEPLAEYLRQRRRMADEEWEAIVPTIPALRRLATALGD